MGWISFPFAFPSFMAFHLSLQLPHFYNSKSIRSENRRKGSAYTPQASNSSCESKEQRNCYRLARKNVFFGLLFRCYTSPRPSSCQTTLSPAASSASFAQTNSDIRGTETDADAEIQYGESELELNRIDCLVRVLHGSARSFSLKVESLKLSGTGPELAMAWVGKDVHGWHKRISYLVAVYALMKTAIEVEVLLSLERSCNNASPVKEILTPNINLVGEYIENQLNTRHSELGEWFRLIELPRVAAFFVPLLKKWSMEYAGSGVAGIVVATSCCAAVGKLGSERVTCPSFTFSLQDVMVKFMDLSHGLVSVEKLHQLATEAGFEWDFLSHFGKKILPNKKIEDLEFWIGLAQKKLSIAFHRETMNPGGWTFPDKVRADTLATLGIFAYLGRRTRLFLSRRGIKDLDEPVRDFLSYLECGSIFIYPEFSCISMYQSFMEAVTDEIGWLDFYAAFPSVSCQERRRSKQHAIQAEKEMVLSTVFTLCYDVFSGFAHFTRSTQQLLDADLPSFLLQSQSLLASCLEDYWAAYGKSSEFLKITETSAHDPALLLSREARGATMESQRVPSNLIAVGSPNKKSECGSQLTTVTLSPGAGTTNSTEESATAKSKRIHRSLLKKYTVKLISASSDIWMGSRLLFVDIMIAMELVFKQLRGYNITRRERYKLKRTLNDVGSLIPVTILMLLPVSAVGHAAILAAINKYMPSMIPSPYCSERLDVVKQLERTKKMELRMRSDLEEPSSKIS